MTLSITRCRYIHNNVYPQSCADVFDKVNPFRETYKYEVSIGAEMNHDKSTAFQFITSFNFETPSTSNSRLYNFKQIFSTMVSSRIEMIVKLQDFVQWQGRFKDVI